jgi:WD40 repeat protein
MTIFNSDNGDSQTYGDSLEDLMMNMNDLNNMNQQIKDMKLPSINNTKDNSMDSFMKDMISGNPPPSMEQFMKHAMSDNNIRNMKPPSMDELKNMNNMINQMGPLLSNLNDMVKKIDKIKEAKNEGKPKTKKE